MVTNTIVIDTNIFQSQTVSRRNLANYRIGIDASNGYNYSKVNFNDGQSINYGPVNNFLIVTSQFPFTINVTIGTSSLLFNCGRFFTTHSPITSYIITNTLGNGINTVQIIDA